jgi:hypothetical protein
MLWVKNSRYNSSKEITKPWREIFDTSGSNISQVNRCVKFKHIDIMNKIEYNNKYKYSKELL